MDANAGAQPCSLLSHRLLGAGRVASRLSSASRTDFAMRGFAISFLMLARVERASFFLLPLRDML